MFRLKKLRMRRRRTCINRLQAPLYLCNDVHKNEDSERKKDIYRESPGGARQLIIQEVTMLVKVQYAHKTSTKTQEACNRLYRLQTPNTNKPIGADNSKCQTKEVLSKREADFRCTKRKDPVDLRGIPCNARRLTMMGETNKPQEIAASVENAPGEKKYRGKQTGHHGVTRKDCSG